MPAVDRSVPDAHLTRRARYASAPAGVSFAG